ncbi:hypothetical protein COL922a_007455 [Colletotrichum nupharicola]|nr:hypothetical protein COL922a_007455 [Colletotrichum nupharicola]
MDGQSLEYADESNAARIVGVVGAFHFLAFSFVSLRIYARVVVLRAFGLDDDLIVVAACLRSLQLNIGIIAACASFLKPLVGRYLKINSSAGYYPSYERYNHSGRTPLGAGTGGSKAQVNSKRRTMIHEGNLQDEYELQKKGAMHIREQQMSPTTTEIHAGRSVGNFGHPMASVYPSGAPSDTNSEELILQKTEPAQGIVSAIESNILNSWNGNVWVKPDGTALQWPNIDEDQSGLAGKTAED